MALKRWAQMLFFSPFFDDAKLHEAPTTKTTTSAQIEKGKNQLKGKTVLAIFFFIHFLAIRVSVRSSVISRPSTDRIEHTHACTSRTNTRDLERNETLWGSFAKMKVAGVNLK